MLDCFPISRFSGLQSWWLFFVLLLLRSRMSTLFPYTTLFRSRVGKRVAVHATGEPGTLYAARAGVASVDRKSTRLNSSHTVISYAVFCLKKKKSYVMMPPTLGGRCIAGFVYPSEWHLYSYDCV